MLEAKEKQKAIELKIQQKLDKETEEREAKMTEARIKISMHKRKNMDIPPELIKIAKLDEKPMAINTKADTMHLDLQQPNPNQSSYNPSNISKPVQSSRQFQGIVGTAMLSDTLKLKKEKLDVHESWQHTKTYYSSEKSSKEDHKFFSRIAENVEPQV